MNQVHFIVRPTRQFDRHLKTLPKRLNISNAKAIEAINEINEL